MPVCDKSFKKKCKEVWEGIEFSVESDVLVTQFYSIFYIRVFIFFKQVIQGGGGPVHCLYFHGYKRICIPQKEIHFQGRLIAVVIEKAVALFYKHIPNDVLVDCPFVCAQVFILPQILLRFLVKRCNQETGIFEINLV